MGSGECAVIADLGVGDVRHVVDVDLGVDADECILGVGSDHLSLSFT